jgi:hypothetical protein
LRYQVCKVGSTILYKLFFQCRTWIVPNKGKRKIVKNQGKNTVMRE